ncbi:MAG: 23S rRNA U2552 (ribose-2'-O)-methylase RlmE/FtsJ [Candidatus Methanohalarchaeum thermophilum]|uniref:Ribosomal RNA large subunit methyltransferase E n=1 Tax=Methanohalarchaeum thermophilum TaxID=1903181 RepID=A0A1Q6DY09_METT1|nr:MAG: 23S rRNA U2552 (ribose-2'-O)-methylase RlmE/FtsJ [Candidatus Methanohalarchaeum thermophilum]
MKRKDRYWKKAKREGYRARSSYKLKQINDKFDILEKGDSVVDLGAAPGGWLQVAKEITGGNQVLGIDRVQISSLEGVKTVKADINSEEIIKTIKDKIGEVDVVLSDVSPDLSGNWNVDHARSIDLSRRALEISKHILKPRGNLLVKVFQGDMYNKFYKEVKNNFGFVKATSPDASRDESAEIYVIGKNFIQKPVSEGDKLKVEIIDKGKEGDGIAKVNDFVIFVPDTDIGKTIKIKIKKVKNNFALAKKINR